MWEIALATSARRGGGDAEEGCRPNDHDATVNVGNHVDDEGTVVGRGYNPDETKIIFGTDVEDG